MNSIKILAFVEPQAMRPQLPDVARLFCNGAAALLRQSLLIVFGNRCFRMILGWVDALLATCIKFIAIPIFSIFIFPVLMVAELWNGRRRDLYPPADVAARDCRVAAAIDHIDAIRARFPAAGTTPARPVIQVCLSSKVGLRRIAFPGG
jgi:hypothetical protein